MKIEYFNKNNEWIIKSKCWDKSKIFKIVNFLQLEYSIPIKFMNGDTIICEGLKDTEKVKSVDIVKNIIDFIEKSHKPRNS